MAVKGDIIVIPLRSEYQSEVEQNAELACVGGSSQVRQGDRMDHILTDQRVGQWANLVGAQWLLGEQEGLEAYRKVRAIANAKPTEGDGGVDLIGYRIDFKGSLHRYINKDPLDYNLPVRPHERHDDWAYVLILISQEFTHGLIMGWVADDELPPIRRGGTFNGAHTSPFSALNPPVTLKENLNGYTSS